jgi:hypothetical protein
MWMAFGGGSATPVWPGGGFGHLHEPKKEEGKKKKKKKKENLS